MKGRCSCGAVCYEVAGTPIVTHVCHCRDCQRDTGSAFVVNSVIESAAVSVVHGETEVRFRPTSSGQGQDVICCATCGVALWSTYRMSGPCLSFVRVGTLDVGHGLKIAAHAYTRSRMDWVQIPEGVPSGEEFYDVRAVWGPEGMARFMTAKQAGEAEMRKA